MKDNKNAANNEAETRPHPPTDHNPYPYPLQKPGNRGWLKALWALIIVAAVVTLICLLVGINDRHDDAPGEEVPVETVIVNPG